MKILLIYASNSDNTRQAALHVADVLRTAGHAVTVVTAEKASMDQVASAEVCILGSCTWLREGKQGQLPEHMHALVEKLRSLPALSGKSMAVFGFGRHEYTHFCAAADELEAVANQAGAKLLVPTLRVDGFYHHNTEPVTRWADELAAAIKRISSSTTVGT